MEISVESFSHLWADRNGPWALLRLKPLKENEVPSYIVVNRTDRSVLVIENDVIAREVQQRMLAADIPIVWIGNGF